VYPAENIRKWISLKEVTTADTTNSRGRAQECLPKKGGQRDENFYSYNPSVK